MMKKIFPNFPFLSGVIYILIWVISSVATVGTMTEGPSEIEWYFPILILVIFGTPFAFGFLAGLEVNDD